MIERSGICSRFIGPTQRILPASTIIAWSGVAVPFTLSIRVKLRNTFVSAWPRS